MKVSLLILSTLAVLPAVDQAYAQDSHSFHTTAVVSAYVQPPDSASEFENPSFGYRIRVPAWFSIEQTNSAKYIRGTLPPVRNIVDEIAVRSYYQSEFSSLDEFRQKVVTDNQPGAQVTYNRSYHFVSAAEAEGSTAERPIYNIVLKRGSTEYKGHWVLMATPKGYVWIEYISGSDKSYERNQRKWDEFMGGVEVIQ